MNVKSLLRYISAILAVGLVATTTTLPSFAQSYLSGNISANDGTYPNLALYAVGTSNGSATPTDDGEELSDGFANDGDYLTRWQSNIEVSDNNLKSEATYTLDFNEGVSFDKVVIGWEAARPEASTDGYTILYSVDGTIWNEAVATYEYDVKTQNGNGKEVLTDTATLDAPVYARYLKVCMFKVVDKYAPSIFEIEVYNLLGEAEHEEEISTSYHIDRENMFILNVPSNTTPDKFKTDFNGDYTLNASSAYVGTGSTVTIGDDEYTVIVKGDPSGDGVINSTDFMQIRRQFLGLITLNNTVTFSADVNSDGNINSTDFMQVRRHFLGIYDIDENLPVYEEEETKNDKLMEVSSAEAVVGEMIYLTSQTRGASVLCDNSGMSGIEAPNHMTAALSSAKENQQSAVTESMFLSSSATAITFKTPTVEAIGGIFIWNYNDATKLNCGIKDVVIAYSLDGRNYTDYGTFTLAKCSSYDNAKYGGNVATNTTTNNYAIDLNGIPAQYIRITPLSNYGGEGFGLSEVRIFRHKETPEKGDIINAEGLCQNANLNASNAANNTGISVLNATVDSKETVSNNPDDMWLSNDNAKDSTFVLNLDGSYPIDQIKIWNYNDPNNLNSGIRQFTLYTTTSEACNNVTVDGGQDYIDYNKGEWTKIGTYTLPKGTGVDGMATSYIIRLNNRHAQHIKIVPSSNYGGEGFGLSEIRAYAGSGWAVEADRAWSGLLSSSGAFKYQGNFSSNAFADSDNGEGWLGGDGCFTTPADDDTVLFTFQDSFLGNYGNYTKFDAEGHGYADTPGFRVTNMKNMAYAMLTGKTPDPRNFQMYHDLNSGVGDGFPSGNIYPERFWLADSTVINNVIYVIAGQVENGWGNGVFDLYKHSLNADGTYNMGVSPSEVVDGTSNKAIAGTGGDGDNLSAYSFNSIYDLADDGYIYLYGEIQFSDGLKRLGVARVKEENFTSMRDVTYWNGSNWSNNVQDTVAISDFIPGGESNVTYMEEGPFAGKYVHIGTENGGYGSIFGTIVIATSDTLTGPFVQPSEHKLYWSPERYQIYQSRYYENDNYYHQWNYNAKAHHAISESDELYITYHYGLHDDRVEANGGWYSTVAKEYEHPSFIRMFQID